MFDQYDVYENGMGLSGRGGGGGDGEKNTSRRKIWQQQKKYFIGAIIQGTISKE